MNQGLATSTISVFTPPLTATSPATFILTMPVVGCIFGIAFDSSNNLWVSDCNTKIYEFTGPFTTTGTLPLPAVTLTSNTFAFGLTFDSSGNLWVALDNATNSIEEYVKPAGGLVSSTPVDHTLSGVDHAEAIGFDPNGNLFSDGVIANQGMAEYLKAHVGTSNAVPDVFDATGITIANFRPFQLIFDKAGNLYVADHNGAEILVYPTGTSAFSTTMAPFVYKDANINATFAVSGIALH